MIAKLKNLAWLVGAIVAVFTVVTSGFWFWVSKNSWISTSLDDKGYYRHCLDFSFKNVKIAGSIITNYVPYNFRERANRDNTGLYVPAAVTFEEEFFGDNRLAEIDELRISQRISIFEGWPIINHIPDMDFKDAVGQLLGTVSFTFWPINIEEFSIENLTDLASLKDVTIEYEVLADFKSSRTVSIERKRFLRSIPQSVDERCPLY